MVTRLRLVGPNPNPDRIRSRKRPSSKSPSRASLRAPGRGRARSRFGEHAGGGHQIQLRVLLEHPTIDAWSRVMNGRDMLGSNINLRLGQGNLMF